MDTVDAATRSRMMAAIHSRDTAPELLVRRHLWAEGWRYRVSDSRLPGKPDIVVPRARALVEIRGCFWHRHGLTWDGRKLVYDALCPAATTPKSNRAFWNAKFRANVRRDAAHKALWHTLDYSAPATPPPTSTAGPKSPSSLPPPPTAKSSPESPSPPLTPTPSSSST